MKRLLFAVALMMFVFVPLSLAIPIEMDDINGFMSESIGVSLTNQTAKVTVNEGQTFNGTIEKVAFLAGKGMKGLKRGDAVEVTYVGNNIWKIVHVPSGQKLSQEIKNKPVNKKSLVIEPGFNEPTRK